MRIQVDQEHKVQEEEANKEIILKTRESNALDKELDSLKENIKNLDLETECV